jgi:hypothetical protein
VVDVDYDLIDFLVSTGLAVDPGLLDLGAPINLMGGKALLPP